MEDIIKMQNISPNVIQRGTLYKETEQKFEVDFLLFLSNIVKEKIG